ncbi:oral-facial-digital syndrome 1 protein homolog [Chenopodium quinoa]|uniref:oral-facial-digital syndrome 1 protein homolog n=1 Tax=Chenopodium quinoa TaxID=63459 RepID=UPI000B776ACF|nr:oral-facial-digital syndrome 1 protein homolog [Chenopodium quinoa]
MELLKLSRLKLQLRALISEVKDLREREKSATEQLHLSTQKQKHSEEEFGRKLKELESELASSTEVRQKLERKVSYLQNDHALLESKQKELNGTIQSLLQSREQFVTAYQESTYDMKRSIEERDRKLKFFSEKLKSHLLLFDAIEKEASYVKQVVDSVRHVVNEKEEVVNSLKRKLDRLPETEKALMGKINEMENRLGIYKDELQRKEKIISELEAHIEAQRISNKNQTQVETLQKTLSKKEAIIQNLISEKQALDSELKSLGAVLEKIQHAFRDVNEDKEAFLSIIESKENFCTIPREEMRRTEDSKVDTRKDAESFEKLTSGGFASCTASSQRDLCDTYPSTEMQEANVQEFHAEEASKSLAYRTIHEIAFFLCGSVVLNYEVSCDEIVACLLHQVYFFWT